MKLRPPPLPPPPALREAEVTLWRKASKLRSGLGDVGPGEGGEDEVVEEEEVAVPRLSLPGSEKREDPFSEYREDPFSEYRDEPLRE